MRPRRRHPRARALLLLALCAPLLLQGYFALRIAAWRLLPVASGAFLRNGQLQLLRARDASAWHHEWTPASAISPWLERAVIASEDATFDSNDGVDWSALRDAWRRNHEKRNERLHRIVGGSTITQQLAKNLFLSPQRSYWRKAQELAITFMLEAILGKKRILEIYLNSVEWGYGIYGAQAAAQHYYRRPASTLSRWQAARLAVMLPAPRFFERHFDGPYLSARSGVIAARALDVLPPR